MSSEVSAAGPHEPLRRWVSASDEWPEAITHARRRLEPLADGTGEPDRRQPRWERRYAAVAAAGDLLAVLTAVGVGVGVGYANSFLNPLVVLLVAAVTVGGTACALFAARAWEPRVLGQGSEEFNRLIRAVISSAVILGLTGLAVGAPGVRPWVFVVIPSAGGLALLGRAGLRTALHRCRLEGRCVHRVLAVGDDEAILDLIERTRRDVRQGLLVDGACTARGTGPGGSRDLDGVAVVGDLDDVATVVRSGGYRVVAVSPAVGWSGSRLRRLAWDLEGSGVELVVQPGLMEIAGPRLHVTPVDGLPLLRLSEPVFTGIPRLLKAAVDRVGAAALLLVLAPLLLLITVAVHRDGGPVLFRQVRVGRAGKPFRMVKFRSMVVDAERRRASMDGDNDGSGPLFKIWNDPRVTRVGRLLRTYSLDELPQLFNVLGGSMSLVGPRPPLPDEVATYSRDAMRKLLVKPGLTGLWQVSGRSDLSWEESVRLDVRYVENWNLALDASILWKTMGAVVRRDGAY